ncbi:hypothetical protein NUW54_g12993 [Trametes sanguinea]|uniref:Uncharacterized protein n=1 Tax=Trametes sanguinea TaxID=158606 RepID=A0ACC1MRT1_9APHY|nr:hypothetical protein NUW54_g12993 [Trametes sanguinea]
MSATKKASTAKSAASKKSAPRAPAAHPPWIDMIKECIAAHPEDARHGVSRPQIKKYVEDKYGLEIGAAQVTQLSKAITHGAEKNIFVLPKGPSGRVKLPPKSQRPADASATKEPDAKPANARKTKDTSVAGPSSAPPEYPPFPPPNVVLHPEDASNKVFLALGRALVSINNHAITVKDLAELAMKFGLMCQNASAAGQAIATFIRNHYTRCNEQDDQPLLLKHHMSGTIYDDDLAPALYSRVGGAHCTNNNTLQNRLTNFRRGTQVWYLSKAAGARVSQSGLLPRAPAQMRRERKRFEFNLTQMKRLAAAFREGWQEYYEAAPNHYRFKELEDSYPVFITLRYGQNRRLTFDDSLEAAAQTWDREVNYARVWRMSLALATHFK